MNWIADIRKQRLINCGKRSVTKTIVPGVADNSHDLESVALLRVESKPAPQRILVGEILPREKPIDDYSVRIGTNVALFNLPPQQKRNSDGIEETVSDPIYVRC